MFKLKDMFYVILGSLIGLVIIMIMGSRGTVVEAQNPYNVYETKSACVYVAGYMSTAHIYVIPKKDLYVSIDDLISGNFPGC
jgi:hypothetical protein